MAHRGSNLAYDLSAYEAPKSKTKPELKMVKSRRRDSIALFNIRIVSSFAIVVTLLSLMVYNQVQLTEVTGNINTLTKQLQEMESENTKMMSVLESTRSLSVIGEQAKNELGMNRRDDYQTHYINLEQEDKIELTENSPTPSLGQRVQSTIHSAIARIQEYIVHE